MKKQARLITGASADADAEKDRFVSATLQHIMSSRMTLRGMLFSMLSHLLVCLNQVESDPFVVFSYLDWFVFKLRIIK